MIRQRHGPGKSQVAGSRQQLHSSMRMGSGGAALAGALGAAALGGALGAAALGHLHQQLQRCCHLLARRELLRSMCVSLRPFDFCLLCWLPFSVANQLLAPASCPFLLYRSLCSPTRHM